MGQWDKWDLMLDYIADLHWQWDIEDAWWQAYDPAGYANAL